ncbi:unnamed protein product [Lupinus luteus]|uniref:Uncharacterized protein n=1 Tax=Lupinus luteus TaxID=3873 RepID=A0AAV1XWJ1_LUPLU
MDAASSTSEYGDDESIPTKPLTETSQYNSMELSGADLDKDHSYIDIFSIVKKTSPRSAVPP